MAITHNYLETSDFKPTAAETTKAELVINLADGTLWSENGAGTVIQVGGSADGLVTGDIGVTVQGYDLVLENTTASFLTADETKLDGIEDNADVNNISDVNAADLVAGDDTTLHFHTSDRSRANHTGTQLLSTISDSGTAAGVDTGTTNGTVPLLDANNQIPPSMLPPLAITTTHVSVDEAAQLALTVEEGDVCVRSDESKTYLALNATNSTMADWQELLSPTGTATALGYTSSATQGEVTNTTGSNAILPSANGTNAGLLLPADFTVLSNTSNTNSGDNSVNSLYSGLQTNVDTTISTGTRTATTYPVDLDGGGSYTFVLATTTQAGMMSDTQFDKLGNISVTQAVDLDVMESNQIGSLLTGEVV